MKLYVYEHCPYCVRARMIFAFKKIPFEMIVLMDDDIQLPTNMVGRKVLPILQKEDGSFMPESMDIVDYVDQLAGKSVFAGKTSSEVGEWLEKIATPFNQLISPIFIKADMPELATESARNYFLARKEKSLGSIEDLIEKAPVLLSEIQTALLALDTLIQSENACNGELSTDDIQLFPILRGLSIVDDINFPPKVDAYIKNMSKQTNIKTFAKAV